MTNREIFLNHVAQSSPFPLLFEVVKAEAVFLYTSENKKIYDLISGVSVSNIGHCHPRVVKAVKKQAETYMHIMVYGEVIQSPQTKLAKLLTDILPQSLNSVYFVNSGSEAVEGALKLAKRFTGRGKIISTQNAYHGSTNGALSVLGNSYFTDAFKPLLPNIEFITYNSVDDLHKIDTDTACVIIEPVQSESGINAATKEFLTALRKKCTETGTLLIFDEIQNGFGRTGTMFAFEKHMIVPDIITFAKGMGGGMPIGAFVADKNIMQVLTHNPILGHITTFGGHPVSCAAAFECISELVENKHIIETVKEKEELFIKELSSHPKVKKIQSAGLCLAVDLGSEEKVSSVIKQGLEVGFLTDFFLFNTECFRIAPPLIITHTEIIDACNLIKKVLDNV